MEEIVDDIQDQLNVKISGEQKIGPFPHWTISTRSPNKRYRMLNQPHSDWFIGGLVAQSLEPWHYPGVFDVTSLRQAIDAYYSLGGLINFYSHTLSTGEGPAGSLASEYVLYGMNTNLHPRLWSTNAIGIYNWWMQRSNAQVTATFSTNGGQYRANLSIRRAVNANTAIELLIPGTNLCGVQVTTNGVLAGSSVFRVSGGTVKIRVGSTVTNAVVDYSFLMPGGLVYSEYFDSVSPPALPSGSTSAATGGWREKVHRQRVPSVFGQRGIVSFGDA